MELDFPERTGPIGYQIGDYYCVSELGEGAFGKVYQATSTKDPNLMVALKLVSKRKIQEEKSARVRAIREKLLKSEVQIMKLCNSDHVVRCYNTYENSQYIILALEYCNAGDLYGEIKRRGKIPEEQAVRILKHIIVGFGQLHKHNIIHRDLKCENIFKHNEKYKIGDFGFAKMIANLYDIDFGTTLGTLTTMAPEVMTKNKYGIKADLWSLGIIFYEMLFGQPPYRGLSAQSMSFAIKSNQVDFTGISKEARGFFERVLVSDPDERISWADVYKEPILYKYQSSTILEDFQEDVDLDESRKVHEGLEKRDQQGNLDKELKDFDEEREQRYEPPSIKKMEQPKARQQIKVFTATKNNEPLFRSYVDRLNFERQKSVLLLEQIVQMIVDVRVPIKLNRQVLEFALLVSNRCLRIASPLYDALKKEKNIYNWEAYNDFLKSSWCTSFFRDFARHYDTIRNKRNLIEQQIYKQETKGVSRLKDFMWKLTDKRSYVAHDNFLCGIEGTDYTQTDQIRYTSEEYLPKVIDIVKAIITETVFESNNKNRLLHFLTNYRRIAQAKFEVNKNALVAIAQSFKPM